MHLIFVLLHLICFFSLTWWALIITVPLHMIYAAVRASRRDLDDDDELFSQCPDCAEWIKDEALVCRYCGRKFAPREVIIPIR